MADAIVTYEAQTSDGAPWSRVTVPNRGSLILYSDGLLNIRDKSGRVLDVKGRVQVIELFNGYIETNAVDPKPTHDDTRARFVAFIQDHLDNDHHWDEYAFDGDGLEYMEKAHLVIHAETDSRS